MTHFDKSVERLHKQQERAAERQERVNLWLYRIGGGFAVAYFIYMLWAINQMPVLQ